LQCLHFIFELVLDGLQETLQYFTWDTVKTYLSPKRTPDEKSKRTPVKSQNVLPIKSKRTIDEVKTYPLLLTNQGQLIDKKFVIDSYC